MDKHEALDWFLRRKNMQLADKCQSAENIAIDCIMQSIANEWISVEESVPEIGRDVLIFAVSKTGMVPTIEISFRKDTLYFGGQPIKLSEPQWNEPYQYFNQNNKVTHWIPLPDPPMKTEKAQRDYEAASDMRDYCEHCEPTYNPEDGSL